MRRLLRFFTTAVFFCCVFGAVVSCVSYHQRADAAEFVTALCMTGIKDAVWALILHKNNILMSCFQMLMTKQVLTHMSESDLLNF